MAEDTSTNENVQAQASTAKQAAPIVPTTWEASGQGWKLFCECELRSDAVELVKAYTHVDDEAAFVFSKRTVSVPAGEPILRKLGYDEVPQEDADGKKIAPKKVLRWSRSYRVSEARSY